SLSERRAAAWRPAPHSSGGDRPASALAVRRAGALRDPRDHRGLGIGVVLHVRVAPFVCERDRALSGRAAWGPPRLSKTPAARRRSAGGGSPRTSGHSGTASAARARRRARRRRHGARAARRPGTRRRTGAPSRRPPPGSRRAAWGG